MHGAGHLAGEAAVRGALVDTVDFSEAMVAEAKARMPLGARPRSSV
jgi:hypothetical protein